MGRVVRFEVFIKFCVQLPFTKARLPCPLVMVDVRQRESNLHQVHHEIKIGEKVDNES